MNKRNIEFLRVTHLRGPNIWTYRPVLEAWVDIGELEDAPSNTIPGFYERLSSWLPGLVEHRCGVGERGGFLLRLKEGTWPAHILEHVTIELQNLAGMKVGFGKARQTHVRGVYKVAVRTRHEDVGRACLLAARDLIMAAIDDKPFDMIGTVARLRDLADSLLLGPSTAAIVDAATDRHIPWLRLTDGNLVQLGHGARQRRIWTAETDQTGAIAEGISRDKDLTKMLLKSCGVPVPGGELVSSPEQAWEVAQDIGLPVVVKPVDGNHGRGVSIELTTQEEVEEAYRLAIAEGSDVIVESFIPGNEHRLLVVGGRVVAAARGETAWVTGDGASSVAQLIDSQLNVDPRRGTTEDYPLNHIRLDDDPAVVLELARQGFQADSVPAAGQKVLIQRNGNVAFDVSDRIHPDIAAAAALATRVIGLDIAGIDLVAEDISRPLDQQRAAFVEVNAGPGLLMHLKPAEGTPRPVGRAIVDHLFAADESGRIPIVGVAGSRKTTLISQLVAWLLHLGGRRVGLACNDGLYFARRRVESMPSTDWDASQRVLMNRTVDAAVFETNAKQILREGLAYDRCHVGVVTDAEGAQQLAEYYIKDPEQMYTILRTQVDVVLRDGAAVLNADDPLVAKMADLCDGHVIFYSVDPRQEVLAHHQSQGGRVVFVRDERVIFATGKTEVPLVTLNAVPLDRSGKDGCDIECVLAAAAAAWALGVPADLIQTGLETLEVSPADTSRPLSLHTA